MPPKLEYVFTVQGFFDMDNVISVKNIKGGPDRMIVPVATGSMKGSDLEAELVPGSTDCLILNNETQTAHLDARMSLRLKDGNTLFIQWTGVLQIDSKSLGPAGFGRNAKSTDFGDHEWFVAPSIETSDSDLKWMEGAAFVAEGRWIVEDGNVGFEYQAWRLRPSK